MLIRFLDSLRLNAKERAIVLKLLTLGPQPASAVARHVEFPRNTVRSILDSLVRRGLLIRTRRSNTQYYALETPENIDRMLCYRAAQQAREFQAQRRCLADAKNELLSWSRSTSRPKVTFYEGWSGVVRVYEDTLTSKDKQLHAWASYDANAQALPEYFASYYLRRAKKGIHITSIHPDTPLAREHLSRATKELRTAALVPKRVFDIRPEVQVYDNKVNIVSWSEKLGIIIESQEIADALKTIFSLSFRAAQSFGTFSRPRKGQKSNHKRT